MCFALQNEKSESQKKHPAISTNKTIALNFCTEVCMLANTKDLLQ